MKQKIKIKISILDSVEEKRMKKRTKFICVFIVISILVGIIPTAYFTADGVFKGSMQMVNNEGTSIEIGEKHIYKMGFNLVAFETAYNIETIQITSSLDGHMIPADYITINGEKNKDTVVMVHGMGGNRLTVYPMAKMFLENGYNVIAYDQRSSGENTARYTTYGYWESRDLADYVTYANEFIEDDKKLGVWGVSFGGATVGIYLGVEEANEKVDFAILDCPISEMKYLLSTEMEQMNMILPVSFMMSLGSLMTKARLGFSYADVDVNQYIAKTSVPILIINSKIDEVTPFFMGEDLYNSITHESKQLFTVEDSDHANVFYDYPKDYESHVMGFISNKNSFK